MIWTDVDGVLSADPRIVRGRAAPPAPLVPRGGGDDVLRRKVLHFPAVLPAIAEEIPLVIRNSFRPGAAGHDDRRQGGRARGVRAVTAISGMCLLSLDGKGMTGIPGIAARVFGATARLGVSVVMFSQASSEQNIALVIPEGDRARTVAALERSPLRAPHGRNRRRHRADADRGRRGRGRRDARDARHRGEGLRGGRKSGRERGGDRAGILGVQHQFRGGGRRPRKGSEGAASSGVE